jgi:chromosome partitioning protein
LHAYSNLIYRLLSVDHKGEKMTSRKTSIVTIANQKGGVGKTTCAVNLASAYAKMGKNVLVIDADAQANTTSHLNALELAQKQNRYLYDAIEQESDKLSQFVVKTKFKNIDILAADARLKDIGRKYKGEINQFHVLHPILKSDDITNYDLVIIDTHPAFDTLPQSALSDSDYYLIPLFPEEHSLQGLADQIKSANGVIKYQNPMLTFLGCVISRFDKNNATHRKIEERFRALAKESGFTVFSTTIPVSNLICSAASQETPIHFHRPGSNIADAYTSLAGEIAPQLKGKRKGRRYSMPDHQVVIAAIDNKEAFETEVSF